MIIKCNTSSYIEPYLKKASAVTGRRFLLENGVGDITNYKYEFEYILTKFAKIVQKQQ